MNTAGRRRLLFAAMLVDTLGGGLLAPFELVYGLRVSHLPLTTAGVILSIAAAAGIAVGPAAGAAVDRLGAVRVVAAANALGAGGCASLVLWRNGWGYGIGAFLLGAQLRAFWGAFTPLVASIAEARELELWFGRLRAARYIGLAAGEALSGVALTAGQNAGLRLIVIGDGLSYVGALALVLLAAPAAHPSTGVADQETGRGYRRALADGVNVALAALNVGATLLLIAPILALPVFVLERLHLSTWLPGLLAGLMTATAAAGALASSRLVRGRRRLRNLQLASAVWALAFASFLLTPLGPAIALAALFAGALMLGIGEAIYAPTSDALPAALAPPGLRGRYAAIHQLAWGISETIAPAVAAAALASGTDTLWAVLLVLALGNAVAYRCLEGPVKGRDGVAGSELDAAAC